MSLMIERSFCYSTYQAGERASLLVSTPRAHRHPVAKEFTAAWIPAAGALDYHGTSLNYLYYST